MITIFSSKEHLAGKHLTKEQEIEYVLNHADTGFRLQTDIIGDNGVSLTSKQHYTKDEMQRLIALADELGINLVPEIDTPGHALSFVKVRPDLMYKGQLSPNKHNVERVAMLDWIRIMMKHCALSSLFMINCWMVRMHRFVVLRRFTSEQMSTMATMKTIVVMSMIWSPISKVRAIRHESGVHLAVRVGKHQLI